jgi:hypothetical protein
VEPPVYAYPNLMRAGLANMLAPWVRCFLWSRDYKVEMLAPAWFKLRLGPYRRREADKRRYERLFTNSGYVAGIRRLILLTWGRRVEEAGPLPGAGFRPVVVRFSGLGEFLTPAIGRSQEVEAELRRITRPELLPPERTASFVGVHVRLADFQPTREDLLRAGEFNMRLPLAWYAATINQLRSDIGPFAVRVFSDGSPQELAPLLLLPDVELVRGGTAITDMLDLSAAACIIASGSTFSTWAAFLGQVPSLWFPGQFRGSIMDGGDQGVEVVWEPGLELPTTLLDEVRARLTGATRA